MATSPTGRSAAIAEAIRSASCTSGVRLEWFWWGSVFWLGVPVMLVLLVAGPLLLPVYRTMR